MAKKYIGRKKIMKQSKMESWIDVSARAAIQIEREALNDDKEICKILEQMRRSSEEIERVHYSKDFITKKIQNRSFWDLLKIYIDTIKSDRHVEVRR